LILIDTSAWIDFFSNDGAIAEHVDHLLESGDAAICGPIETELRRGIRSRKDRVKVLSLLEGCHHLHQPEALWSEAGELGYVLGKRGINVRTLDLLIAVFALSHQTFLLTRDKDFTLIRRAGIPLQVV